MARKYHPDNYANNPLSDLAQERGRNNEAYDTIIRVRKQGGSGQAGGGSAARSTRFADIRSMVSTGRIVDAEVLLDGIPSASRHAEWYFLKGSVLFKKGWLEDAYNHFSTATRMDPGNMEYRSALNQMNMQRQTGGFRTSNRQQSAGRLIRLRYVQRPALRRLLLPNVWAAISFAAVNRKPTTRAALLHGLFSVAAHG